MTENKTKYIGVTVGPIFDTISLASTPAALWAGSYFFSLLSKNICVLLTEKYGLGEQQIISPYYEKDEPLLCKNDGIGLFHDRIIFCADGFAVENMEKLKSDAIEKTAFEFSIKNESDLAYLMEYVMISWASVDVSGAANPIIVISPILDALELAKPYVFGAEKNPLLSVFVNGEHTAEGADNGRNALIKSLTENVDFALRKKDGGWKSIGDILRSSNRSYKRHRYYAIIRSDGDNMGKIISSLTSAKDIRDFSKQCLEFCSKVAEAVRLYGGVPIYAGGDDLLAIIPCESNGETVLDFIKKANEIFAGAFKGYPDANASLSFGVAIAYYKFPLYEALDHSAELLFGVAKSTKNCVALDLRKHSGQSSGVVISNAALDTVINNLRMVINCAGDESKREELLLSAMHKLVLFKKAFNEAKEFSVIENLFKNTFDSDAHEDNNFVLKILPELFCFLQNKISQGEEGVKKGIFAIYDSRAKEDDSRAKKDDAGVKKNNAVLTMQCLLRIMKFYIEKGGE